MDAPRAFETDVLSGLQSLAALLRRRIVLRGVAACVGALTAAAALVFACDFLLSLERPPRAVLLMLLAGLAARQTWRWLIRPLRIALTPERLAATLEQQQPELRDQLLSAVQFTGRIDRAPTFARAEESPAMRAAVIDAATGAFRRIDTTALIRRQSLTHSLAVLALCSAGGLAVVSIYPDLVGVFLSRALLLRDVSWPADHRLALEAAGAGVIRHPRGDDLVITAQVLGRLPRDVRMEWEPAGGGDPELRPMNQLGEDRFRCDFGPLAESIRLRFRSARWGADVVTRWYEVLAIERPQVAAAAIEIAPPAYSRQPPYRFPTGQLAGDVPAASRVTVDLTLNKPVESVAFVESAGAAAPTAQRLDELHYRVSLEPSQSCNYRVILRDADGLEDARPRSVALRVVADRAPTVKLALPRVGALVTPEAAVPLQIEAEDNWGIVAADFEHQIDRTSSAASQAAPIREPLPDLEPLQRRYSHRREWSLAQLGLQPQDRLVLSASARDARDIGEPNVGRAPATTLRIVSRDEMTAELSRRELEWRGQFEQIIKSQEELRTRFTALANGDDAANRPARLTREERNQRQLAGRVQRVRTEFEQILAEMEINQIATPPLRLRLQVGVVEPLTRLAAVQIPAAADAIASLARSGETDAEIADAALRDVLAAMNRVLAQMLKWEGYNEAAALLRDIMKQQGDLNRQTKQELDRQLEELFGKDPSGK